MAKIIDISRPIFSGMIVYPSNPEVDFELTQEAGDGNNALTRMTLGTHTGAHIDSPRHIHADGAGTDSYDLELMNGEAEVVDLTGVEQVITAADLPESKAERVLLKTRNSLGSVDEFDVEFVALDETAAEKLVERGVKLVGLDALSIKKKGVKDRVHEILIDAGIVVLEGIWLAEVEGGQFELMCLPLPVKNLDGAPVRAVLRRPRLAIRIPSVGESGTDISAPPDSD